MGIWGKINHQEPIVFLSRFSHSSPARESKSSRKAGLQGIRHATRRAVGDSSDEEDSRLVSQPSESQTQNCRICSFLCAF